MLQDGECSHSLGESMRSNLRVGHAIKEIGHGSVIKRYRHSGCTLANDQDIFQVQRVMLAERPKPATSVGPA